MIWLFNNYDKQSLIISRANKKITNNLNSNFLFFFIFKLEINKLNENVQKTPIR